MSRPTRSSGTVARTFGGVEHRIEFVRSLDGVRCYNDSIASWPRRTIAGLRCFPEKVVLIAGGYDHYTLMMSWAPEICSHVKILITTGATGPKIRDAMLAVQDQPIRSWRRCRILLTPSGGLRIWRSRGMSS